MALKSIISGNENEMSILDVSNLDAWPQEAGGSFEGEVAPTAGRGGRTPALRVGAGTSSMQTFNCLLRSSCHLNLLK